MRSLSVLLSVVGRLYPVFVYACSNCPRASFCKQPSATGSQYYWYLGLASVSGGVMGLSLKATILSVTTCSSSFSFSLWPFRAATSVCRNLRADSAFFQLSVSVCLSSSRKLEAKQAALVEASGQKDNAGYEVALQLLLPSCQNDGVLFCANAESACGQPKLMPAPAGRGSGTTCTYALLCSTACITASCSADTQRRKMHFTQVVDMGPASFTLYVMHPAGLFLCPIP